MKIPRSVFFIICMLLSLLFAGCSSLSQSEAESIALSFVDQNVKFFARPEGQPEVVTTMNPPTFSSYREGSGWAVAVHVSGTINGTQKKNDLLVRVSDQGKVVEFNGKQIG